MIQLLGDVQHERRRLLHASRQVQSFGAIAQYTQAMRPHKVKNPTMMMNNAVQLCTSEGSE